MEQIVTLLEDEIEKRVTERLNQVLEKVSRTYDISMRQLMRDLSAIDHTAAGCTTCKGITGKGKRCSRSAKDEGYCNMHIKQKPVKRVATRQPSLSVIAAPAQISHTHTLPPLFMSGCPACEKTKSSRDNLTMLAALCV